MVLAELGGRLQGALRKMAQSTIVDDEVIAAMVKEIQRALLEADVNIKLVKTLSDHIKNTCKVENMPSGVNRRVMVQKAVFDALVGMLSPEKEPFKPQKGRSNVIMFVGLQGSGKTTSCTKMAYWYQRKGWKTCLVCADTYRAGAYDQVKQNATKANIPYYGSYTERDPVRIADDGVEHFKSEKYEIIIVDTSGRHKQEAALFEEMEQVAAVVNPDDIVFVLDSSIGQAAFDHAQAFRNSVEVGSVIMTKLDGHAKGGGALSAVAATKSPVTFVGTGEHIQEFEPFKAESFVGRLLGRGDLAGLVNMLETTNVEEQKEMVQKIMQGRFCLRVMYDQFQQLLSLGPISQIMEMIPGLSQMLPKDKGVDGTQRIKQCLTMMDSMTDAELDSVDTKIFNESRIRRIARGSGVQVADVHLLFQMYKPMQKMMGKMKGLNPAMLSRGGNMNARQMASMMDPRVLQQMGGATGLQNLMKQFSKGGFPGGGMPPFG